MIKTKPNYRQYRRYYHRLNKLYQEKAVKDFTFLILSLLTIAFFILFAIKPSLQTIGGLVKEVKDKKEASEKLEQKINALSLAQKEYLKVQPELPYIYAALPQTSKFSQLIKQLEYLARKNNVVLSSFRLDELDLLNSQKIDELLPIAVSLAADGNYQNLKSFTADLENLERLVILSSFALNQEKSGREGQAPISLIIEAEIYSLL